MAKFDYKQAKAEIAQINAIVETCPQAVQEKCFELLFAAVFGTAEPTKMAEPIEPARSSEVPEKPPVAGDTGTGRPGRKLPSNVLGFMHRYTVTADELEKLFILDHDPLLPVYKIPGGNTARAQLYKVMMVLLENGLLNNQLTAPYSELRENVREDGLFDGNFNKTLKKNYELFRSAITKDTIKEGENVELTGAGLARLSEIIKRTCSSVGYEREASYARSKANSRPVGSPTRCKISWDRPYSAEGARRGWG